MSVFGAARGVSSSPNWAWTAAAAACQPSWSKPFTWSASAISWNADHGPSSEDTGDASNASNALSSNAHVLSGYIKLPTASCVGENGVMGVVVISGEFDEACSVVDGNDEGTAMTGDGCTKWLTFCGTALENRRSQIEGVGGI